MQIKKTMENTPIKHVTMSMHETMSKHGKYHGIKSSRRAQSSYCRCVIASQIQTVMRDVSSALLNLRYSRFPWATRHRYRDCHRQAQVLSVAHGNKDDGTQSRIRDSATGSISDEHEGARCRHIRSSWQPPRTPRGTDQHVQNSHGPVQCCTITGDQVLNSKTNSPLRMDDQKAKLQSITVLRPALDAQMALLFRAEPPTLLENPDDEATDVKPYVMPSIVSNPECRSTTVGSCHSI
nr:hypothetical protein CFP56_57584 [Quercus suber]